MILLTSSGSGGGGGSSTKKNKKTRRVSPDYAPSPPPPPQSTPTAQIPPVPTFSSGAEKVVVVAEKEDPSSDDSNIKRSAGAAESLATTAAGAAESLATTAAVVGAEAEEVSSTTTTKNTCVVEHLAACRINNKTNVDTKDLAHAADSEVDNVDSDDDDEDDRVCRNRTTNDQNECHTASTPSTDSATSRSTKTNSLPVSSILTVRSQDTARAAYGNGRRPRTERRVRGIWRDDNVVIIQGDKSEDSSHSNDDINDDVNNRQNQASSRQHPRQNESIQNLPFEKLRDETLITIMSFLDLADLLRSGMVCRRWSYQVRYESSLWKWIDASSFVQSAYQTFLRQLQQETTIAETSVSQNTTITQQSSMHQASPSSSPFPSPSGRNNTRKTNTNSSNSPSSLSILTKRAQRLTGSCLESILQKRKPESLIITGIHDVLDANHFHLPSHVLSSLQELTLSHFNSLSDTHLHVLLLMTLGGENTGPGAGVVLKQKRRSKGRSHNSLRLLALEHCKLLTNSSLTSIAKTCGDLASLSLSGNTNITDISPLQDLFVTKERVSEDQIEDNSTTLTHESNEQTDTSEGLRVKHSTREETEPTSLQVIGSQHQIPNFDHTLQSKSPPPLASFFAPPQPQNNVIEIGTSSLTSLFTSGTKQQSVKLEQSSGSATMTSPPTHQSSNDSIRQPPSKIGTDGISSPKQQMISLFSPPSMNISRQCPSSSVSSLFTPPPPPTSKTSVRENNEQSSRTMCSSATSNSPSKSSNMSPLVDSTSGLTNLFNIPGSSPPRKPRSSRGLDSSSLAIPGLDASNTNANVGPSVGMRRYQRHQRSLSNTNSSLRSSSVHGNNVVGTLNRLDLTQTAVTAQNIVGCFLDLISFSSRPTSNEMVPTDIWGWLCLKELYMSPGNESICLDNEGSPTREELQILEKILLMEELDELHVGDDSGASATKLVTKGQRDSRVWQELEKIIE
mmetsp:Transcript_24457/g.58001  ORF Transcript_24457/g.58001 Transcript_24457/m.58001 type:complete len:962 (-) Transcript_24457:30-2915(-)